MNNFQPPVFGDPQKDALQYCIELVNQELSTHVAFPVSFLKEAHRFYVAAVEFENAFDTASHHAKNEPFWESKKKPLSFREFVKRLDSQAQYIYREFSGQKGIYKNHEGYKNDLRNK